MNIVNSLPDMNICMPELKFEWIWMSNFLTHCATPSISSFETQSKCSWSLFDDATYSICLVALLPSVDVLNVFSLISTVFVEGTIHQKASKQPAMKISSSIQKFSENPYWRNGRKENKNKMVIVMDKKKIELTMDARNLN